MPDAERRSLTLNYNKALPSYHTSVPNRHGGGQSNPNKALIVIETLGVDLAKRVPQGRRIVFGSRHLLYPCTGMRKRLAARFLALAITAALPVGCSGRKSISRDEVQSEIRSLRSFAAEAEMFLDFVLRGQSTRRYAVERALYLEDEIRRSEQDVEQAVAAPGAEDSLQKVRNGLGRLIGEISNIRQ